MANGSFHLREYPPPMVRLSCEKCGRAGRRRFEAAAISGTASLGGSPGDRRALDMCPPLRPLGTEQIFETRWREFRFAKKRAPRGALWVEFQVEPP